MRTCTSSAAAGARSRGARGRSLAAYEGLRARHGIGPGLVVGYEAEGIDPGNNACLAGLAARRPRVRPVACLPPTPPPAPGRAAALLAAGHLGLALYLPDRAAAGRVAAWPAQTLRLLDRHRAVLSLNARPEATAALGPLLDALPSCPVLFAHLGLPGRHAAPPAPAEAAARLAPLLALADRPQVRVKLSGLHAVDPEPPHRAAWPFVALLPDRFGPARCHWGSDFAPALDAGSFADTLAGPWAALAEADRALMMGGGLAALLDGR